MYQKHLNRLLLILSGALFGGSICFIVMILVSPSDAVGLYTGVLASPPDAIDHGSASIAQIQTAHSITDALYRGDYKALSAWVSPDKGVTVVPFSTIDLGQNITFTPSEIRNAESDKTVRIFGVNPADNSPISLTSDEFFKSYMRVSDFSAAPVIGLNRIVRKGNAVENISEVYPDCVFVDLCYPSSDSNAGVDWYSMKVVLEPSNSFYVLVALVRGAYTSQ